MSELFSDFAQWLSEVFQAFIDDAQEILQDWAIWAYGNIADLVVTALESVPDFDLLAVGVLQSAFGQLDGGIVYMAQASGFGSAAAIVGTGYAAYWLRKIVTLGRF